MQRKSDDDGAQKPKHWVVWLPPKPAQNACRHLVRLDAEGRIERFLKQTYGNLRMAPNGDDGIWDRELHRRACRWLREMKGAGFYSNR